MSTELLQLLAAFAFLLAVGIGVHLMLAWEDRSLVQRDAAGRSASAASLVNPADRSH